MKDYLFVICFHLRGDAQSRRTTRYYHLPAWSCHREMTGRTESTIVRHSTMPDTSRNYVRNYTVRSMRTNAAADNRSQRGKKDPEITFSVHPYWWR